MKLTALRPNNPVAVMAAYGALRLLPGGRLRWAGPHPELEWEGDPIEKLSALLPNRLEAPEVKLLDDVVQCPDLTGRIPGDWLIAYACQCPPSPAHGRTGRAAAMSRAGWKPTGLLLLGGRHKFVANARKVMQTLARRNIRAKLEEALIGPWRYEDIGLQAWGWDAAARIDAASSVEPVTEATKLGVLGAYWLAWESLPLWPMVNGGTVGMERHHWGYPTCAEWLGVEGLRSLILGAARMHQRELSALGVTRWRTERIGSSDYGGVLGWAMPQPARTPSERQHPGGFARQKSSAVLIV